MKKSIERRATELSLSSFKRKKLQAERTILLHNPVWRNPFILTRSCINFVRGRVWLSKADWGKEGTEVLLVKLYIHIYGAGNERNHPEIEEITAILFHTTHTTYLF